MNCIPAVHVFNVPMIPRVFLNVHVDAFGHLERVAVSSAVHPRLSNVHHYDTQSTTWRSQCVNTS